MYEYIHTLIPYPPVTNADPGKKLNKTAPDGPIAISLATASFFFISYSSSTPRISRIPPTLAYLSSRTNGIKCLLTLRSNQTEWHAKRRLNTNEKSRWMTKGDNVCWRWGMSGGARALKSDIKGTWGLEGVGAAGSSGSKLIFWRWLERDAEVLWYLVWRGFEILRCFVQIRSTDQGLIEIYRDVLCKAIPNTYSVCFFRSDNSKRKYSQDLLWLRNWRYPKWKWYSGFGAEGFLSFI